MSAIAAASGCNLGTFGFDEGIDVILTHRSDEHTARSDRTARLEVQLKATSSPRRISTDEMFADLSQDRFTYYSTSADSGTIPKIIVIMRHPAEQWKWVYAQPRSLSIFHASYWVNIAGWVNPRTDTVRISAPRSQIFDDTALCDIMTRIGQGGAP